MKIGIDIDDTITATTEIIDFYAKEYTENVLNREFKINKIDDLDPMWARFVYKWSNEEDKRFWDLYYEKNMENVKPKENAIKVINELYKDNEIIIISARWDKDTGTINKITKEWFEKYNINYHKLYLGHKDKTKIVEENKINLFIDDSLKTCTEIQSIGVKSLIMTTRLNKNADIGDLTRVNNWNEIYEEIQKNK